eukprot:GHVL01024823.1.p1 GENE.GHVL01024823.1~~GHVL01024823.1.p1  ORF type:complete len:591 (+),score=122.91 GHVL01024823.1:35-1774(+)
MESRSILMQSSPYRHRFVQSVDFANKAFFCAAGMCAGLACSMVVPVCLTFLFSTILLKHSETKENLFDIHNKSADDPIMHQLTRFADVAGVDEAKMELQEIVDFLRDPEKFRDIGAQLPKGVLLVGPPGSGKTMLARAVATEAVVPFLFISGSEFVELYVGQGSKRVRNLFAKARSLNKCVMFIDEIDAVGMKRSSGGNSREYDQTLNQLLVEMDGFNSTTSIIVIAATNRLDILDPALTRSGRFDRRVYVPLPDIKGREKIIQLKLKNIKYNKNVNIHRLAKATYGFSGADIANLVNEAALQAARDNLKIVGQRQLEQARDKVIMGPERRSTTRTAEERKSTAFHESGHAIVAYYLKDSAPIHKATIVLRGGALGYVERVPDTDSMSEKRAELEADMAVAMGGRVAEEEVFGRSEVTTGASSDIHAASKTARRMVVEWGMSDKVGPVNYLLSDLDSGGGGGEFSEDVKNLIEAEIRKLVNTAKLTAEKIIRAHRKQLNDLAASLLEVETLTGDEIRQIIESGKIITESEDSEIFVDSKNTTNTSQRLEKFLKTNPLGTNFIRRLNDNVFREQLIGGVM